MKQELVDKILNIAPKLYYNEPDPFDVGRLSPNNLKRFYGPPYFSVSDGWFSILYNLSEKLEAMDGVSDVRVVQIKEKFGGLRFYLSSETAEMSDAIDKAETASYYSCELCGGPGKLRHDLGWVTTLCEAHYNERNKDANL